MRSSMRSDWASRPTRGSRLVGLLSMIMTRVFGSGLLEQERVAASRIMKATEFKALAEVKNKHKVPRLVSARERASNFARDDGVVWALRIRDLSQDCWALRSGRGWNI